MWKFSNARLLLHFKQKLALKHEFPISTLSLNFSLMKLHCNKADDGRKAIFELKV